MNLKFWIRLGEFAGISEQELRDQLEQELKIPRDGIVGCSWYKCAFYEQDGVIQTFRCTGCHNAMYCGPQCQDRDWKEGAHKAQCKDG
ncbi:hypothetical protein FRB98_009160 [Tulasnella sp. 332]|nr:hypothetical protein FRB98_009160 [Tulasnella sp. 332]